MILTLRIVSDEVDNFVRELQIDSTATFLDLHNAICDAVGYDKRQLSSFFICDDGWEKGTEITLEDMGADAEQDVYIMDETELSDYLDDEGQRLLYTFDYATERSFFMEVKKTEPGKTLAEPVVTRSKGEAPAQVMDMTDFEASLDAQAAAAAAAGVTLDVDDDFYGSTDFNEDELDLEGFEDISSDDLR
ncbi:MAG: hypothetical protein HUK14_11085 [Muribaculaceae bacterium]|nr:hypothetical protein [Muribaculaceae bacterium]